MTVKDAILLMVRKAEIQGEAMAKIAAEFDIGKNAIERMKYDVHAEKQNQYREIAEMLSKLEFITTRHDGSAVGYANVDGQVYVAWNPTVKSESKDGEIVLGGFQKGAKNE